MTLILRKGLRRRCLKYALAVEPSTKVWRADPNQVPVPPSQATGRPRRFAPPSAFPEPKGLVSVARELPGTAWKTIPWRMGTKGPMRSRFARVKVWTAHGWKAQAHPERAAEWLLIEWPEGADAPSGYWLAWPADRPASLRHLICMARSRWRVELDYRELKDELGLGHFEGDATGWDGITT